MVDTWKCDRCGNRKETHPSKRTRPWCSECESRDAVLVEMEPVDGYKGHDPK